MAAEVAARLHAS